MTATAAVNDIDRIAEVVPPALSQSALAPELVRNSADSRVVIERVAQIGAGRQAEARAFAAALVTRVNSEQAGLVSVLMFEETFGTRDRLHFLFHLESLAAYYDLLQADLAPSAAATGGFGGRWNELFTAQGVHDTVLIPQFWGMYGTSADGVLEKQSTVYRSCGAVALPPARQQTALPDSQILHSANSGIVMHRSAQPIYNFRSEARTFAREVAESINNNLPGECTVFVYEEGFGSADRLHWLIHLRDLTTYMRLLELHVRNEQVRDIYFRDRIPAEKGGGTWARIFVESSMHDVALTPSRAVLDAPLAR
jgi:hypothetical protein